MSFFNPLTHHVRSLFHNKILQSRYHTGRQANIAHGRHPNLTLTTKLLDAHIYVFRRTVLDLLAGRRSRDLDSMREQVIPWLVKGGWQRELGERWEKSKLVIDSWLGNRRHRRHFDDGNI